MSTRKAPKRNTVGRQFTVRRRAKKYVDPIIGMGSKGFLKKMRERDAEMFGPADPAKATLRKRMLFVGGLVNLHASKDG